MNYRSLNQVPSRGPFHIANKEGGEEQARQLMTDMLRMSGGNVALAARRLEVSIPNFWYWARRLNLSKLPEQIRRESVRRFTYPPISRRTA